MKKLGLLAMAFALIMTMTQCKKENTTISNDEGSKVPITLNVNGASTGSATGGSRVVVEGSTGVVTFENGDVIHVVSNGVYVGTMTYNGTVFSGEVTEPTEGQKLQFYFLGNKTPEFNADNTSCSVVISDQTEYLPVISYAPSRENYQVGLTAYNATLLNKCALVKFNVTTSSEAATCITGMNNKVTIDFSTNEFTYGQEGEGIVTLAAGNGEKWAILLPQDEIEETYAYSFDGICTGTCALIPAIVENDYLSEGIDVTLESQPIIPSIIGVWIYSEYDTSGNPTTTHQLTINEDGTVYSSANPSLYSSSWSINDSGHVFIRLYFFHNYYSDGWHDTWDDLGGQVDNLTYPMNITGTRITCNSMPWGWYQSDPVQFTMDRYTTK